jgi:hypothetical protein
MAATKIAARRTDRTILPVQAVAVRALTARPLSGPVYGLPRTTISQARISEATIAAVYKPRSLP